MKHDEWVTPSACGSNSCVQVKYSPRLDTIDVSDGPDFVEFTREEWTVFVDAVKKGEYDL